MCAQCARRECRCALDTQLGERSCTLSGGQRQRLALARALHRDAPVFILDEHSSALDTETEAIVADALAQRTRGRTMLVIAHRLSTIAQADTVVVMRNGEVVESGAPAELARRPGGAYAALVAAQARDPTGAPVA